MDATPNILIHPKRVYDTYNRVGGIELLSKLKLIVILRDPVAREYSLYIQKRFNYKREPKSDAWYSDVVFANNNTIMSFEQYSEHVLAGQLSNQFWECDGKYFDRLKHWMFYFQRKQLLVLSYDEIKETPKLAQRRIEQFLGAEFPGNLQYENFRNYKKEEISPLAVKVLTHFFKEKNLELYEFLDEQAGPSMEQHPFPRFTSDSFEADRERNRETQLLLPNLLLIGAPEAGTTNVSG